MFEVPPSKNKIWKEKLTLWEKNLNIENQFFYEKITKI